jgi:PAS domain S-box-containing protein
MADVKPADTIDHARFHLAAIVNSADDAIISKNLNSIIQSWNEAARKMFGYTADEMIGQSILKLIPDDLKYEEDQILEKLRAGQRIDHYETIRRRKDGSLIQVSVTISPIKDETGRVIGASKIARDISDRKRVEKLLLQSEKLAATGRMAAAIAHEINNPLESVMNLIFLARQDTPVDAKAHKYLATAESELERVSHIARQTLGYYRDSGPPSMEHLHELMENVLTVYRGKLLSSGIRVETTFNDLQKIVVSKGEMIQVFSNILANAIDAMAHGGTLRISTRNTRAPHGDGVLTTIRDEGSGIRTEHLERIFDPFFTTKGDVGTGIGLWVARELVEKRGGQIGVVSNTEAGSSGTSVSIFVPFTRPHLGSPSSDERDESHVN